MIALGYCKTHSCNNFVRIKLNSIIELTEENDIEDVKTWTGNIMIL